MSTNRHEGSAILDGTPIWYAMQGTGPALVVQSPGWGIGSAMYRDTLADLAERFTLVFHDPRGSGRSVNPYLDYASVHVGQFVADLEALASHLDLARFSLLGHSHGGYIAMNYALAFPDRVHSLVLVDAQLGVDEPAQDLQRTLPRLAQDPAFSQAVADFTGPRALANDQDFAVFLRKIGPLYFKDPEAPAFRRFLDFIERHPISLDAFMATSSTDKHFEVRSRLANLRVPTLCMVGEHDFICSPVQAQAIVDALPDARLVRFADSGHFPWIEEPSRFRAVLGSFLAGHGTAPTFAR